MKILHYGPEPCFLYDPICWLHLVNISMTIPLHMMDAPAVQVAVKTELPYWNDTIIAFYFECITK